MKDSSPLQCIFWSGSASLFSFRVMSANHQQHKLLTTNTTKGFLYRYEHGHWVSCWWCAEQRHLLYAHINRQAKTKMIKVDEYQSEGDFICMANALDRRNLDHLTPATTYADFQDVLAGLILEMIIQLLIGSFKFLSAYDLLLERLIAFWALCAMVLCSTSAKLEAKIRITSRSCDVKGCELTNCPRL